MTLTHVNESLIAGKPGLNIKTKREMSRDITIEKLHRCSPGLVTEQPAVAITLGG